MPLDRLLERDVLPDGVLRFGIRRLLRQRLRAEHRGARCFGAKRRLPSL